jgi:hypothetical protein
MHLTLRAMHELQAHRRRYVPWVEYRQANAPISNEPTRNLREQLADDLAAVHADDNDAAAAPRSTSTAC